MALARPTDPSGKHLLERIGVGVDDRQPVRIRGLQLGKQVAHDRLGEAHRLGREHAVGAHADLVDD